jgi:class II flagellar assembly regulator FliX
MKVTGPNGVGQAGPARSARPAAGQGFSLGGSAGASAPSQAASAQGMSGVSSVDALIAMQEVDGPLQRRRRAVRRAGRILDVLDEVKLAILDGGVTPAALSNLDAAVKEQQGETDDPALSRLLREIETRAAVEMAKLEMARRAA